MIKTKASYFSLYIKIEPMPIQNGRELFQLNKIHIINYFTEKKDVL